MNDQALQTAIAPTDFFDQAPDELRAIVKSSPLTKERVREIVAEFRENVEAASSLDTDVYDLVVTDESQKDLMDRARVKRIALKTCRAEIERKRVALKEQSLRTGQLIDGISNVLKGLISPAEAHLLKQERFVEIEREKREETLKKQRSAELSPYCEGAATAFEANLGTMSEERYASLLSMAKAAYESRQAQEQREKEEAARVEREREEERERVEAENARLKAEAEEREAELIKEREEKARLEREEAKRKAEEEAYALEQAREREMREFLPDREKLKSIQESINALGREIKDVNFSTVRAEAFQKTLLDRLRSLATIVVEELSETEWEPQASIEEPKNTNNREIARETKEMPEDDDDDSYEDGMPF